MKKCPRCGTLNPIGKFRCMNNDCLDILSQDNLGHVKSQTSSLEEQANVLMQFASKFVRGYVDRELSNSKSVFKGAHRERFLHERFIVIIWLIDKFLADSEHKLTAIIHEKYFRLRGLINNKEEAKKEMALIMSRHKEYYAMWNYKAGASQQFLAAAIAKNIFGSEKPILNASITFEISTDLLLMIKSLKEL